MFILATCQPITPSNRNSRRITLHSAKRSPDPKDKRRRILQPVEVLGKIDVPTRAKANQLLACLAASPTVERRTLRDPAIQEVASKKRMDGDDESEE